MSYPKLSLTSLLILIVATTLITTPLAKADTALEDRLIKQLQLVGEYDFNYLFWDVYIAKLYSRDGTFVEADTKPYVLQLTYQRSFSTTSLIEETRKQLNLIENADKQKIEYWLSKLSNILINVNPGDTISLHVNESYHSQFFHNDIFLGKIQDQEFSRMFSGIWLSEKSQRPRMRNSLVNQGK